MTPKQKILACLSRSYLVELGTEAEVPGAGRMKKDDLVGALSKKRSVRIENVLNELSLADLKSVRPMRTKWASCSTSGRLTLEAALPDLPHDLQDYVIVHELLHFQVPNHGKLWKSLMHAHLGDFEKLAARLNLTKR